MIVSLRGYKSVFLHKLKDSEIFLLFYVEFVVIIIERICYFNLRNLTLFIIKSSWKNAYMHIDSNSDNLFIYYSKLIVLIPSRN